MYLHQSGEGMHENDLILDILLMQKLAQVAGRPNSSGRLSIGGEGREDI